MQMIDCYIQLFSSYIFILYFYLYLYDFFLDISWMLLQLECSVNQ